MNATKKIDNGPRGARSARGKTSDRSEPCCGPESSEPATHMKDGRDVGPGGRAVAVDDELKRANLKHLKRIEGQVRGLAAMVESDRYCADIIQQCAAVQESLRSVAKNLLKNHLRHCAAGAMRGDERARKAMVEELVALVGKAAR